MKIVLIVGVIILNSFHSFAKNKLLIFYPNSEYSFLCEYKIKNDTMISLYSFQVINTFEIKDKIPLLNDINLQSYYSVRLGNIKKSKTYIHVKTSGLNLFDREEIYAQKIDISNLQLSQIIGVTIGERNINCGNLRPKVKKIISNFSNIKTINFMFKK
jgi:hypothetical protein